MNTPVRMAILDMNNNVENMGIASIKRIADRFAVVDYDVFDVRYKAEVPGLDYDIYISSGGVVLAILWTVMVFGTKLIFNCSINCGPTIVITRIRNMLSSFAILSKWFVITWGLGK